MTDDEDVATEHTTPELDLLELAWGVIANAGWDGIPKSPGWQDAAIDWRERYHALLGQRRI